LEAPLSVPGTLGHKAQTLVEPEFPLRPGEGLFVDEEGTRHADHEARDDGPHDGRLGQDPAQGEGVEAQACHEEEGRDRDVQEGRDDDE